MSNSPHPDPNVPIAYQRVDFGLEPLEARLMDHNDLYVLDFGIFQKLITNANQFFKALPTVLIYLVYPSAPSLKTLAIANVLEHKLNLDALPESIQLDIRAMTLPNSVTKPLNNAG